ncbi:MAG TPA: hypothetical protein VH277_16715 [Gemmatimonadaceae bacterium]|jgi:hypothetical protein|nr:hypothetical protein [Gemmatimonadaceae bacterium]
MGERRAPLALITVSDVGVEASSLVNDDHAIRNGEAGEVED